MQTDGKQGLTAKPDFKSPEFSRFVSTTDLNFNRQPAFEFGRKAATNQVPVQAIDQQRLSVMDRWVEDSDEPQWLDLELELETLEPVEYGETASLNGPSNKLHDWKLRR